jgi:hypothetical protein
MIKFCHAAVIGWSASRYVRSSVEDVVYEVPQVLISFDADELLAEAETIASYSVISA